MQQGYPESGKPLKARDSRTRDLQVIRGNTEHGDKLLPE
jgi:hypothetical protein